MTNTLFAAVNRNTTVTENGMATLASSLDSVTDLFFKIGASRGKFDSLKPTLSKAMADNLELTVRVLLWARDAREGAGERQLFKDAIKFGFQTGAITQESGNRIAARIPELGRWDDLYAFFGTPSQDAAIALFAGALRSGDGLAAKWSDRKGLDAVIMRKAMGLSPRAYRKLIVSNTNVVEQKMCAKQWDDIDFGKLPSVASARYQKAFWKNAEAAYKKYVESLVKGEAKINAGAVYPYDITKSVKYGDPKVANEQWKALPDYMEGTENRGILPVVDVSGSMTCKINGDNKATTSCLDVAVSLGLYLSERNRGIFKDQFVTFSSKPQMVKVNGNLQQRLTQMERSPWEMNTNLQAVFDLLLDSAVKANVPEEQMPETILILSDMQFDAATGQYNHVYRGRSTIAQDNPTGFEMISEKYKLAGYTMPKIVFWNLNSKAGVPVEFSQSGAALVSGFSPAIMRSVLRSENFTPVDVMTTAVMIPRYDW